MEFIIGSNNICNDQFLKAIGYGNNLKFDNKFIHNELEINTKDGSYGDGYSDINFEVYFRFKETYIGNIIKSEDLIYDTITSLREELCSDVKEWMFEKLQLDKNNIRLISIGDFNSMGFNAKFGITVLLPCDCGYGDGSCGCNLGMDKLKSNFKNVTTTRF